MTKIEARATEIAVKRIEALVTEIAEMTTMELVTETAPDVLTSQGLTIMAVSLTIPKHETVAVGMIVTKPLTDV